MIDELFQTFTDATVYFVMGAVGTILFMLRVALMLLFGGDGGDFDVSDGGGVDVHADGFHLFSILSVLSFMMGAGWLGLACRVEWGLSPVPSALLASIFGFALMLLSSFGMYQMRKMDAPGAYTVQNCVGRTGRVYLRIPEKGRGRGQVEVTVNGRRMILSATSTGEEIESFAAVKIIEVRDDDTLIVERH